MKYAGLIKNDIAAGAGLCVTFFTQGCPHHCAGCHNPETWSFDGGLEFKTEVLNEIIESLMDRNIKRSLCIMGGEPLCLENEPLTLSIILEVKAKLPNTPIYVWTGYTIEELLQRGGKTLDILNSIDYLIDGPFIKEYKDPSLKMRGSTNQRIIDIKTFDFSKKI